jgi:hypothetical protein
MARNPTEQIGIRLPVTLGDRLREIAVSENNHLSAVMRRLLTQGLDELEGRTSQRREGRSDGGR